MRRSFKRQSGWCYGTEVHRLSATHGMVVSWRTGRAAWQHSLGPLPGRMPRRSSRRHAGQGAGRYGIWTRSLALHLIPRNGSHEPGSTKPPRSSRPGRRPGRLPRRLIPVTHKCFSSGRYALTVPVLHEQLTWWRKPSRARYDSVALPWPTMIFELNQPNRPHQQRPSEYLIGDDCPSFFSYERAFRAFFYGDFSASPGQDVPSDTAVIRVVNSAAWLERVVIKPAHMDVVVGGSEATGARVELNSQTYQTDARVGDSSQVRLTLPDGLPSGSWLYLSRGRQWLDYRAIGDLGQAELARAGIEVEQPEDPETEIQILLAMGEGQQVEFKSRLPGDSPDSKRTVFKTVAAFANGTGGDLVFGIDKDEATICGLENIDPLKERDRLIQLARSIVTPAPAVEVHQHEVDGKKLLVLSVDVGTGRPYGITPGDKNKPIEFYVRRGATTFPARPEEIRGSVLARVPSAGPDHPWSFA